MSMKLVLKGVFGGQYNTKGGVTKLRFEFSEEEYVRAINLLGLLNKNTAVEFANRDNDNELIGDFLMTKCDFDNNFKTKITLETTSDQVRPTSLNTMANELTDIILEVEDEV